MYILTKVAYLNTYIEKWIKSYYEHNAGDEFETRKENLWILTRRKIDKGISSKIIAKFYTAELKSRGEILPWFGKGPFFFSTFSYWWLMIVMELVHRNYFMKSEKSDRFYVLKIRLIHLSTFHRNFSVLWGTEISVLRPYYRNFCTP